MTAGTLVLGLGNILLHDEGLGVWVADALRRQFEFPTSVTILEGGTLGLDLLPRLDGVGRLLLIDAVRFGGAVWPSAVPFPQALRSDRRANLSLVRSAQDAR